MNVDVGVLEKLVKEVDEELEYDGHLTIMKFTTGWKVVFKTPCLSVEERDVLNDLPSKMSITQALNVAKIIKPTFSYKWRDFSKPVRLDNP